MPASRMLKGTMPLLVLSVLREGERYGYEIAQAIRRRSGDRFMPSEGALYPTLHRLEADGALVATWQAGEHGPRRRYYRLTPKGGRMLEAHEAEWAAFSGGVASFLAEGTGGG